MARPITLFGSLSEALGEEVTVETPMSNSLATRKSTISRSTRSGVPGKLAEELFEELVVPSSQQPTFVRDYPEETSPADAGTPLASRAWPRSGTFTCADSSSAPAIRSWSIR